MPIPAFVYPGLLAAAVAYTFIARRTAGKKHDAQFSDYRAGPLAQRLGLRLVEGDPAFNLFINYASAAVRRGATNKQPLDISIRMQGEPHFVPIELVYHHRAERESDFSTVTYHTWFECRMIARGRQAFPSFEVVSRNAPLGPITQALPLPAMPTGNAAVDLMYLVATREPGMAQFLGQVLGDFSIFGNAGVHLVGEGQTVAFVMHKDKDPLLANALYNGESMIKLLSEIVRRMGG